MASYVRELAASGAVGSDGPTQAITLVATATPGDFVVMYLAYKSTAATTAAVTDSRGNTWTIDVGPHNASNNSSLIASTLMDVGTLQSGDTVTVTLGGGVFSSPVAVAWWIEEFSGLAALDRAAIKDNSSGLTGASGTTDPTAFASEVAIAGITVGSLEATLAAASYSTFTTGARLANGRGNLAVYKILSSVGAQSETFNWTTTADVSTGMVAAYRDAAPSLLLPMSPSAGLRT